MRASVLGAGVLMACASAAPAPSAGEPPQEPAAPPSKVEAEAPPPVAASSASTSSADVCAPVGASPGGSACPANCLAIEGEEIDAVNACRRGVFFGCSACPGGCGGSPEGHCFVSLAEGRVIRSWDSTFFSSGWRPCTSAELQQFWAKPFCP